MKGLMPPLFMSVPLQRESRKGSLRNPCKGRGIGAARKGQFFLLGAFLVSTLFFIGLPRPASMNVEGMEDLRYLYVNLQKEIPNAFNLGLGRGDYLGTVKNFTWFADRILKNRRVTFSAVLGFGNNISTTDFNVTVFNYYGSSVTVNITIGSTMKQLVVANNQSNDTSFTGVGSIFNISFRYAGEEKNMTWARDKSSIYGMINLTRTESAVIKDFYG